MEEQVLLLALEQPPSLPALTAAVSRHSLPPPLSCGSEGAQGTRSLAKGMLRAGTRGREVPHHPTVPREDGRGSAGVPPKQGYRAVVAPIHSCLPARGSPSQRIASGGSCTMGGQRGVSEPLWPCRSWESPRTSPCCGEVNRWPMCPAAAEHRPPPAPMATGLGLRPGNPWEDIGWQHGAAPGPAQEAPGALLARQGAEKTVCSHGYRIRAAVPTAPSPLFMPRPSTEPQKNPIQRGLGGLPGMSPTTLTTTSEDGGCGRAPARVCSRSGLPHAPTRSQHLLLSTRKALA